VIQTSLLTAPERQSSSTAPRLRPYQLACLEALERELAAGKRRLLVALPTGTGKTVCFAALPSVLGLQGRWLVLAHREELLDQALRKFEAANPGMHCAVEQADRRAHDADVVIASVPTLQRRRLEALRPDEFAGVIVDEAHHAVADSYKAIFDHFGLLEPGCPRPLIGFTATPKRGDDVGLSSVFEVIAYEAGIRQMITDGYLSRITGSRVQTDCDLSGVKVRAGEFVQSELAATVNTEPRNLMIVRAYRDLCDGRRAIAFCVDVAHAHAVADAFNAAGIRAESVSGETPKDERRKLLSDFGAGAFSVISNCAVLTEGFDDPGVSCILMARPTKSSLLYTQMIGRGTRLAPGKVDCHVIDFADNSARHRLSTVATLFGLPADLDLQGKDALEAKERVEEVEREHPWIDLSTLRAIDELKLVASKIEFFSSAIPEAIESATRFSWIALADGSYRLSLPEKRRLEVTPTRLDTWVVTAIAPGGGCQLGEEKSLEAAIQRADSHVASEHTDALRLIDVKASWRRAEASEKQIELIRKLGIVEIPTGLTKGQASAVIDRLMASGRGRRQGSDRRCRPSGNSRWFRG
jgi:superfamily II DNA or RNA helicase